MGFAHRYQITPHSGLLDSLFAFSIFHFPLNKMLNDINLYFDTDELPLADWELLLIEGWDRVGTHFFRRRYDYYRIMEGWSTALQLMPLRYNLTGNFTFSKSQRIIQKRNADLTRVYRPAVLDDEKFRLFDDWYLARFARTGTIFTWISSTDKPFPTHEVCLYKHDKLIGCSFFDVTSQYQYSTLTDLKAMSSSM